MANKKIGRAEWLGSNQGGMGHFVKYCPHCREKIYLVGDEMNEFLLASYVPRLWQLIKHYLKIRVQLPKIHFNLEWQNPREEEIKMLNQKIELSDNKKLVLHDPKLFSRTFFEKKYSAVGGIKQLEHMVEAKYTPTAIGQWFGFSRQRAFNILQSYKFQKLTD